MKRGSLRRVWVVLASTLFAVLALAFVSPAPVEAEEGPPTATVLPWGLNLRSGPGINYPVLAELSRGQVVELAGYRNADASWVMVKTKAGMGGWVGAGFLSSTYPILSLKVMSNPQPPQPAPTPPPPSADKKAQVRPFYLNVREGPGVDYKVVGLAIRGYDVELTGYRNKDASWVQIRTPGGVTGWVNSFYLHTDYPLMSLSLP